VPLNSLAGCEPDTEICIVELADALLRPDRRKLLASFARPHIGVITNIAPVHLEKVGTLEGVVRAKSELIDALPPGGTASFRRLRVARDDLDVVRVGEDVTLESFEPPLSARRSARRGQLQRAASRAERADRVRDRARPRPRRSPSAST
jgi:UDP-N-acetylmuramyl pentapeptide synthase